MTQRFLRTKDNIDFCVSVIDTNICIIIHDLYTSEVIVKFFTDVIKAKEYIKDMNINY
jgi:hypothetical protein